MVVTAEIARMDPRGLRRVEELFDQQIETGVHPGAALAVYRHGMPVLDLYSGVANQESGKMVAEDTMFVLYSSTKAVTSACLHILWERGKFDWDDTVAAHWPEFAQKGKEEVTIKHVMTHESGFPDTPSHMTWDRWHDWEAAVEAMEQIPLDYKPGRVIAYHPRNFGWVVGELVRRIDGRPIERFVREEITGPQNIEEFHLGIDPSMEDRVAKLYPMEDCDRTSQVTIYNRPEVHTAVLPAGGGIATARGLARFYAMMAGGGGVGRRDHVEAGDGGGGNQTAVRGAGPQSRPAGEAVIGLISGRPAHCLPGQRRYTHFRARRFGNIRRLGQS